MWERRSYTAAQRRSPKNSLKNSRFSKPNNVLRQVIITGTVIAIIIIGGISNVQQSNMLHGVHINLFTPCIYKKKNTLILIL